MNKDGNIVKKSVFDTTTANQRMNETYYNVNEANLTDLHAGI